VNYELERIWKEAVVADFRHSPAFAWRGLGKLRKYIGMVSLRDLSLGPPEYKAVKQSVWPMLQNPVHIGTCVRTRAEFLLIV
jgi:hypothetical protein